MNGRDLASNLEFWSGRARGPGGDPPCRRRSMRLPSPGGRGPRGRTRPLAAAALLATLAAGWLVTAHRPHASADATAPLAPPPSVAPSSVRTTTTVPRTPDCRGLTSARREVRCVLDTVALDVRLYSIGTVAATYRRAADAAGDARSGPPACAQGVPDERAWSVADFPEATVGRYRCRFEHGLAAMWWTRHDRLFHAVAPDGDLAGLFSWWRNHPAE